MTPFDRPPAPRPSPAGPGGVPARVLVVEDERAIAEGVRFNLELDGHRVTVAGDGPTALAHYRPKPGERAGRAPASAPFDAVILDLMLPGMSGYDICRAIREVDRDVPVLMLTARTLTGDKVEGFQAGADQYLTKPFALPELLARVRGMLARPRTTAAAGKPARDPVAAFGDVSVDFDAFRLTVTRGGTAVTHDLTTQEMGLLRLFAENPGRVLSRQEILDSVWPPDADVTPRTIDNFVMRLRKKVEPDPSDPVHLVGVRGTGYRFEPGGAG